MNLYEALTLLIGIATLAVEGAPWFIKVGKTLVEFIKKSGKRSLKKLP